MHYKLYIVFLLMILSRNIFGQTIISGKVKNEKQVSLPGASILIENSYYGTTSAPDGSFSFNTPDTGTKKIIVTLLGYKPWEQVIRVMPASLTINPILKEAISEMNAVTVTAGSFEASDRKRATVLKSVDILTTAGQQADIVAALKTLPGTQQVGETEGLFVRGGTGYETKVFIDGIMVSRPFYSSVPDIAQRGRFSPLLFKGTIFSSGGYSAQYGQALSSVLLLESLDLPIRTESNILISSAQLSITEQKLNKEHTASAGFTVNYSNLAPYFSIVSQKYHYSKSPEIFNTEINARKKTRKGILKFYGYANYNTVSVDRNSIDIPGGRSLFSLKNNNVFGNITWSGVLNRNWKLYAGISYSFNAANQ